MRSATRIAVGVLLALAFAPGVAQAWVIGAIEGTVTDQATGKKLADVTVTVSLVRAPVRVVYEAGSPGGCSGGAGSCDPIQISVHVGARGAACSPDGVSG